MKKIISVFLSILLLFGCFAACDRTNAESPASQTTEKLPTAQTQERLKIVTTIFPIYDWVREILGARGENAELTMLLDSGVDLHNYQPTVDDILKISDCNLFLYVGGESDEWVEDVLATTTNKNMVSLNLLELLGDSVKSEEIVEGMEHEHDEDSDEDEHDEDSGEHEHDEDGEEHEHAHEEELDEHVWLSLRNASVLCGKISEALAQLDPDNAETYRANTAAYREKLAALDAEYREAVDAASFKTLLFGDRFPFRYLVDDYGLSYYAAFSGCSAESEASFATISFLAGKVDELGLHTVLTIEGPNHRIAETIVENTNTKNQQILSMDSLQSVTSSDIKDGVRYLTVMERNLAVLKQAIK